MDMYRKKRQLRVRKRIGAGGTRVVYDLGDGTVLKIARSAEGIRCNRMEVMLYRRSSMRIKKYLARVIRYDAAYRWIVMKKYVRKFPAASPAYRRKLRKAVAAFLRHGIIPSKGVARYDKPHTPNLRLRRNRQIVVIDYGGFHLARD
jgi:hypothetical protein